MKKTPLTRRTNTRNLRRILIVCEGEETEPNYFRKFKENPDVYVDVHGIGYNTESLVQKAIGLQNKAYQKKEPYSEVWCVFDKDDFSNEQFHGAIALAEKNKIECAYSIEAFELWYMLHFNFYATAFKRDQYKEILTSELAKLKKASYRKNNEEMYKILESRQKTAIRNAKKLYEQQRQKTLTQQNPITTVFKLVERLLP